MNLANRLGISLAMLIVMALAILLALAPSSLEAPLQVALAASQRRLDTLSQLIVSLVSLFVAVVALLILVAEWRRPSKRAVVVSKTTGGTAELAIESVAMRLKQAAEAVAGVREASTTVRPRRGGIDVLLNLAADSDLDLPEKSKEVMEVVRSEAEGRMGIPVKALRVTFKHSSQGGRRALPPISRPSSGPPDS
ncbi:MAG TPA: alkaline shock response membrane anchor protein AmaP [Chloroflexota bacterium]